MTTPMSNPYDKYGMDSDCPSVVQEIYWRMIRDQGQWHPLPLTADGWYESEHPALTVALFQRLSARKN